MTTAPAERGYETGTRNRTETSIKTIHQVETIGMGITSTKEITWTDTGNQELALVLNTGSNEKKY